MKNASNNNPDNLNDMKSLPAPYELSLKIGAFVMILVNASSGVFVNGTTGVVRRIDRENECIEVQLSNGNVVPIIKYTWNSEKLDFDIKTGATTRVLDGSFTQYPLTLAWAITTHKAQGRTLPRAYIEFTRNAFAPGQIYVALSRTRSFSDLFLSRQLMHSDFLQDIDLNHWYSRFNLNSDHIAADDVVPVQ